MSEASKPESIPSAALPRKGGRRAVSLLLGFVIFASGVLVGAGGAVLSIHAMVTYRFKHPENAYARVVDRIDSDVHLTPEQRAKVEEIIEKKRQEFMQLISEGQPKMEAHWQSVRNEIAAVLDEKQAAVWKEKFDSMHSRLMPPFLLPPDAFGPPPPPH
ncbi:MAG: hypothetical protein K1Y02_00125 [Candidatus Hydrogenedentes bacterium]|nr:hypothetical protein [Candidatus Hydrogenedentota bacterium]